MTFHITFFILLFACMVCIVAWNEFMDEREWAGFQFAKPVRFFGWVIIAWFFLWFFCLIGDHV